MATKNNASRNGAQTTRRRLLDRSFDALSDHHRRHVLRQLAATTDRQELTEATLAATADDPERERIKLHHQHLPKLAAEGYVEWDRTEQVLRPGARFAEVELMLELLSDDGSSPSQDQP